MTLASIEAVLAFVLQTCWTTMAWPQNGFATKGWRTFHGPTVNFTILTKKIQYENSNTIEILPFLCMFMYWVFNFKIRKVSFERRAKLKKLDDIKPFFSPKLKFKPFTIGQTCQYQYFNLAKIKFEQS